MPRSPASRASSCRDPEDPERHVIAGPSLTDKTRVDGLRRRRHRDDQIKFFTIAEVAERLRVSMRYREAEYALTVAAEQVLLEKRGQR
jgi:hypothetical protein